MNILRKMYNFTVIFNTRGRPFLLGECLASIFDNASEPDKINVRIRHDNDDAQTLSYIARTAWRNVEWLCGERPFNLIASYNNLVNGATDTNNILVMNDDAQLLTKDWDRIAIGKIAKSDIRDGIYLLKTWDDSVDRDLTKGYCSFPIISKKAIEVLGFFMPDRMVTLGGDSAVHRIYDAVGRVINCEDIKISHVLHNTYEKVVSPDTVALEYRKRSVENGIDPYTTNLDEEIKKFRNYIHGPK